MKKIFFATFISVSSIAYGQNGKIKPNINRFNDTIIEKKQIQNCVEYIYLLDTITNRIDTLQILNCLYVEKKKKKK